MVVYKRKVLNQSLVYFCFAFVCVFIYLPGICCFSVWGDEAVFVYVAKSVVNGDLLYKDVFDHKGPLLYLIYGCGLNLSAKYIGIHILEMLSLFIASIFMYKAVRLFYNTLPSLWSVLWSLVFFYKLKVYGCSGCEEWLLPFISCGLYQFSLFIKYGGNITLKNIAILSFCFVCSFLIKLTAVAFFSAIALFVICYMLNKKQYGKLIHYFMFFLIFSVLFISPLIVYALWNNILYDIYFANIRFNLLYPSDCGSKNGFIPILKRVLTEMKGEGTFPVWGFFYFLIPFLFKKRTIIWIGTSVIMFFCIIACSIGRIHPHYYIICVPILCFVVVFFWDVIYSNLGRRYGSICILSMFLFFNVFVLKKIIKAGFNEFQSTTGIISSTVKKEASPVDIIHKYTAEGDRILVAGNGVSLYLESDRLSSSKYSYIYPIINISSQIKDEYIEELRMNPPKLFIKDFFWSEISNSITSEFQSILDARYSKIEDICCDKNLEFWRLR